MKDLDQMIEGFQSIQPSPEQSLKWSMAYQSAKFRRRSFFQISAGLAAGLLLGLALSYSFSQLNPAESNFNATYVRVTINSP